VLSAGSATSLDAKSSQKELQTAYRKRARELHPDKNPDPQAAVLFEQLQQVYAFLSDVACREVYDQKVAARAARAKKDAQLDASLSKMKRDLLAREAEAARKVVEAANLARERAMAPKRAADAAEMTRRANEQLIRDMQAKGMWGQQQTARPSPTPSSMYAESERAAKSRRTSAMDSGVHAGIGNGIDPEDEQKNGGDIGGSTVDAKQHTIIVRWGKGDLSAPTSATLTSFFSKYGSIEHVFHRGAEKRKAMLVFRQVEAAHKATSSGAKKDAAKEGWEVRLMDKTTHAAAAQEDTSSSTATNVSAASASPVPPVPSSTPSSSSTFFSSTSSFTPTPTTAPSPAVELPPPIPSSSTMSATEYEMATMQRMAAIAKQKKLQKQKEEMERIKHQQQQQTQTSSLSPSAHAQPATT